MPSVRHGSGPCDRYWDRHSSSLTTRGRAFVSAGLTAVVCCVRARPRRPRPGRGPAAGAAAARRRDAVTRGRHRLGLARLVTPTRVSAGQAATVELALSNEGRTPDGAAAAGGAGALRARRPTALRGRPDGLALAPVGAPTSCAPTSGASTPLGPMTVRVADPFGLVELDRTFSSTTDLVVTPASCRCRRSRCPACGPGPATTGRGTSPAAAPRT